MLIRPMTPPSYYPEMESPSLTFNHDAEVLEHAEKGAPVVCQIRAPFLFMKAQTAEGFINPEGFVFGGRIFLKEEILFFNDSGKLFYSPPKGTPVLGEGHANESKNESPGL